MYCINTYLCPIWAPNKLRVIEIWSGFVILYHLLVNFLAKFPEPRGEYLKTQHWDNQMAVSYDIRKRDELVYWEWKSMRTCFIQNKFKVFIVEFSVLLRNIQRLYNNYFTLQCELMMSLLVWGSNVIIFILFVSYFLSWSLL